MCPFQALSEDDNQSSWVEMIFSLVNKLYWADLIYLNILGLRTIKSN